MMGKDKPKILFLIESLEIGGAERSLISLLHHLDGESMDIHLYLLRKKGLLLNEVPSYITIHELAPARISMSQRILFWWQRKFNRASIHHAQLFWKQVAQGWKQLQGKFDLAIAYNQGMATYFVAEKVLATNKVAWINTDYQAAGYKLELDLNKYQKFDQIVMVSKQARDSFMEVADRLGFAPSVQVIKDITDPLWLHKKADETSVNEFDESRINIVTVARLVKPKGLDIAIQSCRDLIDRGHPIQWFVIGEGPERENLQNLISRYDLEDRFLLIGARQNPFPYVKAANIYVQSSRFEGLGLTLIEASYLYKPIVTTSFKTVGDLLDHEKDALIVGQNAEELADGIHRLIGDPALQERFIENLKARSSNDATESLRKVQHILDSALLINSGPSKSPTK